MEQAEWLHGILVRERMGGPVLIGQSMGGYLAQCFMERFPGQARGFISIDSAPLQRRYVTAAELWALRRCGERDRAGLTRRYNRRWSEETGIPLVWLQSAGHNSNTDVPDQVNSIIQGFLREHGL